MRTRSTLTAVLAGLLTGLGITGTTAGEYEFFSRARYPGPGKRPGVDLYEITQGAGAAPQAYERREVVWWPRKGVDIIEIDEGMPLRTWTLRDRTMDPAATAVNATLGIDELTRRLTWKQPRKFTAHLIGFRGLGNTYGNPFGVPPDYYCPAAVLRMEDGTKRCFPRGTFVEQDERYLVALYAKEITRIRATLSKAKYTTRAGWPDNAQPGEPGTMQVNSEHFTWFSGSQSPPGESNPWVNAKEPERTRLYRDGAVEFAENMWAYQEYAGMLMPYWDRPEQLKYAITVCGTYRDGEVYIGGYAGGGYGGCGIRDAGGGPWSMLLAHEWGHGVPLQIKYGGGEILADACALVDDPAGVERFSNNARRPWRNCVHGSYQTGMFYGIMGDDPNWSYCMVVTMPLGQDETSLFHTLARVGEQRGLFANGIRGVGDMMGEFAARQAEFDCELRDGCRRTFMSVKRNYLEAVDRRAGLYRIPWAESPEPFGTNIIRLVPEMGAEKIAVDFHGFFDPDTYSDWRACIVAVDAEGKARYSPLWSKGPMEMKTRPGDRRFWLTVAATPYALPPTKGGGGNAGNLLHGRHAYRYPYEVTLTACRPGTPHNMPGDTDDYGLAHLGEYRLRDSSNLCTIANPGDSPPAAILRETLPSVRAKVDAFKKETDRLFADGKISGGYSYERRLVPHLEFIDRYVDQMLDGIEGHRHANGGGWVAASAEVAPTAYVGPDAMVLGGAKVLDDAAIEDFAVVRGPEAVVSGHARISGQAYVAGQVKIGGYTRVLHPITAADEQVMMNEVPLRPFQLKGSDGKLWANYALDRAETEVLEDWFRSKDHHTVRGQFHVLNLNGHLHGKPGFVVDGPRRGFHFDGSTQYAEAAPNLADLGEITVDVALRWEGGKNQTVFDFGTSIDNRFTLTPAGVSGEAELVITVAGHTERIVADAALPKDKWSRCRVEIDGKKITLWIDGRKAAEKASAFRPADVFPAGAEDRNFIAAARNATGYFKGTLDHLRVFHTVHENFAGMPEPRQHSSRRVSLDFVDAAKRKYAGGNRLVEELVKAQIALDYGTSYQEIGEKIEQLRKEIESSSAPPAEQKNHKLAELEQKLEKRRQELTAEFEKRPETIKRREEIKRLEERARELQAKRKELAKSLQTRLEGGQKDEPPTPTAEEKARMAANQIVLAEAAAKMEQAKAQVQRLEESFKTLPEVAKLQAQIDELTKLADVPGGKTPDRPELEARLNHKLAELRVNTPEYVRWWRRSEVGAPRLPHPVEKQQEPNMNAMVAADPQIRKLDAEIARCQTGARTLRPDPGTYVTRQSAELTREVTQARMAVTEARQASYEKHGLERNWLASLNWQFGSRFYNKPYRSCLEDLARAKVGREDQECQEEFGSLESLYRLQTETTWHTRCDWDWRLKQEIDGSIAELPLLQKWLERSRGTVGQ